MIDARKAKTGGIQAKKSIDGVKKSAAGLRSTLKRVGPLLASFFGAFAAIRAVKDTVKVIGGFEDTIAQLAGVTRRSMDNMTEFTEVARELGATTRFSAQEAAEGLLALSRAGFTAEESIAAIPATLDLAIAGVLGLGEAAELTSTTIRQFALEAAEAEHVADVLVGTANRTNVTVQTLGESFKYAGPAARAAGISMEETAAALGMLGNAGIQASMAGTNFRGVLAALSATTEKTEKALTNLGLGLDDVDIERRGLIGVFREFRDANLGLSEAVDIFGRRNAVAAILLSEMADETSDLSKELRGLEGEAKRNADLMNQTLFGAFKSLRSVIEEAYLAIGERGFGEGLKSMVVTMTGAIRILVGMEDKVTENVKSARKLALAIKFIGGSLAAFAALKTAVLFGSLARSIFLTTKAVRALTIAVAMNPLGFLVTSIAAAAGALFAFKDKMITFGDTTATIGDYVVSIFNNLKDRLVTIFGVLGRTWRKLYELFRDDAIRIMANINDNWNKFLDKIFGNWTQIFTVDLSTIIKGFASATIGAIIGIGQVLSSLVNQVKKAASSFMEFDFTSWKAFKSSAGRVKDLLTGTFISTPEVIKASFMEGLKKGEKVVEGFSILGDDAAKKFLETFKKVLGKEDAKKLAESLDFSDAFKEILLYAEKLRIERENGVLSVKKESDAISDAMARRRREIEDMLREMERLRKKSKETAEQIKNAANDIGDAFVSAFEKAVFATDNLRNTIKAMLLDIEKAMFRAFVSEPMKKQMVEWTQQGIGALMGMFSPGGGGDIASIGYGEKLPGGGTRQLPFDIPTKFEKGGVIGGPFVFPMRTGMGIAGEKGEEAIMPLAKDSQGRLGVKATETAQAPINVSMYITTPDANSFRQSRSQIMRDLNFGIRRGP